MTRRILAIIPLAATALVLSLAALTPQPASAAIINFTAAIDGAQAFSTTCGAGLGGPSAGTGVGTMTYDTATNILSWNITFSGTSTAPSLAHFHGPGGPGVGAGVQVTIGDLTSPSTGSSPAAGPEAISALDEADLLAGLWYINYHTTMCGGGEIRGQVLVSSVGGVAELPDAASAPLQQPDQSSGTNAGSLAGIVAVAMSAAGLAGAGVWYARRRVRS